MGRRLSALFLALWLCVSLVLPALALDGEKYPLTLTVSGRGEAQLSAEQAEEGETVTLTGGPR